MERYIGTKIVLAEPMDQWTAFKAGVARGTIKVGPTGDGPPGYKVVYDDGYVSWSPKETFERAYRVVTAGELQLLVMPSTVTEQQPQ